MPQLIQLKPMRKSGRLNNMKNSLHIPPLNDGFSGSWIVSRKNGEVIGEFYNKKNVEKFNGQTCIVETALQYLQRINKQIAAESNS